MVSMSITYLPISNLASDDAFTYGWSARCLMTSMTDASTAITYDYDQSGMRVRKTVNGVATNYTYNRKMRAHMTKMEDILYDIKEETYDCPYNILCF